MAGASLPGRALAAALGLMMVACGQKGPPLAPLRLVPAAVTDVSLRRVDDRAHLRFVLPTQNANGPGPVELDRVEVFAVTIAPGAPPPPNRDLLTRAYLVGQIPVRPAPVEGETPVEGQVPVEDPRPAPGEAVTFEETLGDDQLTPVPFTPPVPPAPPAAVAPPGAAAAAGATPDTAPTPDTIDPEEAPAERPAPSTAQPDAGLTPPAPGTAPPEAGATPTAPGAVPPPAGAKPPAPAPAVAVRKEPVRIYVARGVTRGGRPGAPSARVELPILAVPPPPSDLEARVTEEAVVLEWTPPEGAPAVSFNVYAGDDERRPLNPKPLPTPVFEDPVTFGEERCYRVRSASAAGAVIIEGAPSDVHCLTPQDVFPPAAPTGLAAVSTPGQISLIWNANTEPDLAGYLILRGSAPEGPLQPLVAGPVRETSYRDTTVEPGVRYVYAVVAVDTAASPNMSAMSPQVEETAR